MIATRVELARLVLDLAEKVAAEIPRSARQVERLYDLAGYLVSERDDANLYMLLAVLDADEDGCGLSFDGAASLGRWVNGRSNPALLIAALSVIEIGIVLDTELDEHREWWGR
jgi:hypothetical protein